MIYDYECFLEQQGKGVIELQNNKQIHYNILDFFENIEKNYDDYSKYQKNIILKRISHYNIIWC
jgi:hypothetical protein